MKENKDIQISVVIPMYNSENTITWAVNSVLNQTYSHIINEIIVVNDGSTDNSLSIVSEIAKRDKRIKIINQENSGPSLTRNKGVAVAKSDWIAFLDSDDQWIENKIEKQIYWIKQFDMDFISGIQDKQYEKFLYKRFKLISKLNIKMLCVKQLGHTPTWMFKKECFLNLGGFNLELRHAEDQNLLLKFVDQYKCYFINEQLSFSTTGKSLFGESGLSGNLDAMHKGFLYNYKQLKNENKISLLDYSLFIIWEQIKFFRRKILVNLKKRGNN